MTESSFQYWYDFLVQARDAYNFCTQYVTDNNIPLGLKPIHEALYQRMRDRYTMLPAQACVKVYKEALAALRSIRSNKHKNAETPKRKQLALRVDKRLYSDLTVEGIKLTGEERNKRKFYPFVKFDKMKEMFSTCKALDPLIFIRDGKIFLSVPFEAQEKPISSDISVGVDLGVKRLFVTSEGNAFKDEAYLREKRKIRYLKRCLQSKGTKSAKRHLKKMRKRERNLTKDMVNRACNALIQSTDASIIVLEDLSKIKTKTSKTKEGYNRKGHNRRLGQVPLYLFKEVMTYKAPLYGKKVETVSPTWTSQTDCRSGKRDGNRIGCRYYCSDGVVLDADWNASVNIAKRGNHPLSNDLPIDGGLSFLNGRGLSAPQSC